MMKATTYTSCRLLLAAIFVLTICIGAVALVGRQSNTHQDKLLAALSSDVAFSEDQYELVANTETYAAERMAEPETSDSAMMSQWPGGNFYCMGSSASGQLGVGLTSDTNIPQLVTDTQWGGPVASGNGHTLALDSEGGLYLAGDDTLGQFGNGPTDSTTMFFTASAVGKLQAVAAGTYHSLLLADDGKVYGAGEGYSGQLGNGGVSNDSFFEIMAGGDRIAAFGNNSFVVSKASQLWVFGENLSGELGTGVAGAASYTPAMVIDSRVIDVDAGVNHTLVLMDDGSVMAMGLNTYGQFGDGTTDSSTIPKLVIPSGVKQVVAGNGFSLFLMDDGSLRGVGANSNGQLGTGDTAVQSTLYTIEPGNVVDVASGADHIVYVKDDGSMWGCGNNSNGQLGLGDFSGRLTKTQIRPSGVGAVYADYNVTYFLERNVVNLSIEGITTVYAGSKANFAAEAQWSDGRSTDVTSKAVWSSTSPDVTFQQNTGKLSISPSARGPIQVSISYFGLTRTKTVYAEDLPKGSALAGMGENSYSQLGLDTTVNQLSIIPIDSNKVISMAGGLNHSMYVREDGSVWAMGDNSYGQLGTGDTIPRTVFSQVIPGGALRAVCGDYHSLIIMQDGSLLTAGLNSEGQLGDGTQQNRSGWVEVEHVGIVDVAAGAGHSVFLDADGNVFATGRNLEGQLGDGTTSGADFPRKVLLAPANVSRIVAGKNFTLMINAHGDLYGMGSNSFGELGLISSIITQLSPTMLAGGVKNVATGAFHTLYVDTSGNLHATGRNTSGQLGDGTNVDKYGFITVPGMTNVDGIGGGGFTSYILVGNNVFGTGENSSGQFGDGSTTSVNTPKLLNWGDVANVGFGENHVLITQKAAVGVSVHGLAKAYAGKTANYECLLHYDNGDTAWVTDSAVWAEDNVNTTISTTGVMTIGASASGQTVNVSATYSGQSDAKAVDIVTLNLLGGTLYGAGDNSSYQLGDSGNTGPHSSAFAVDASVAKVASGVDHTLYLKTDGTVWGMGGNASGQLGLGDSTTRQTGVQVTTNAVDIAAGDGFSLIVKADGSLWAMGANLYGQLGTRDNNPRNLPTNVINSGVTSASVGHGHSLVIRDGELWVMGDNSFGQLGLQGIPSSNQPEKVDAGGVTSVAAGHDHSLYIKNGALYGMGANTDGQLGLGTNTTMEDDPRMIATSGIIAVAAGDNHSLFITNANALRAMGWNGNGQLGIGTTVSHNTPQPVDTNVTSVAAGSAHSIWRRVGGALVGAGSNNYGQLVQGTITATESTPSAIATSVRMGSAGGSQSLYIAGGTVVLSSLSIVGPTSVPESAATTFQCMARYSDGSTQDVTGDAVWAENSSYSTISAGILTTIAAIGDWPVTITASYDGQSASHNAVIIDGDPMAMIYVDPSASAGVNNGTSWTNAFLELRDALPKAGSGSEIWIVGATYRPTATNDRRIAFTIPAGAELYGGFAGGETVRSARDPITNVTTLSGDIGGASFHGDNSFNVVETLGAAVIDGFVIRDGHANGGATPPAASEPVSAEPISYEISKLAESLPVAASEIFYGPDQVGGGLLNVGSSGVSVVNCKFTNNFAVYGGGAVYNRGGSATYTGCTFTNNSAVSWGGAIFNTVSANVTVVDCKVLSNLSSGAGGAMMSSVNSTVTVNRTYFRLNSAGHDGGAIISNYSNIDLVNCLFWRNTAGDHGGVLLNNDSVVNLTGCTLNQNSSGQTGGAIESNQSTTTLLNTIVWGNAAPRFPEFNTRFSSTVAATFSCLTDTTITGTNVIYSNPRFADSATGDLKLQTGSPCIDTGSPAGPAVDIDNLTRIGVNDIGAHEFGGAPAIGNPNAANEGAGGGGGCSTGSSPSLSLFMLLLLLGLLSQRLRLTKRQV